MSDEQAVCNLCGEPMPQGETMFNYHGYSGPCPKPPLPKVFDGFSVEITIHSKDGENAMEHPDKVRHIVGAAIDKCGLSEEIDYTLNVRRIYG